MSKFLSLVLRHRPEVAGIALDAQGWVEIDALLQGARAAGRPLTVKSLHEIVADHDKQRFSISDDGRRIRANQGHSIRSVDLDLSTIEPPTWLYHGTVQRFLENIRRQGLIKRKRNHVHLSVDRSTATRVGARRGEPVVLGIRAGKMHEHGFPFLLSDNGVWLTDHVPVEFIEYP